MRFSVYTLITAALCGLTSVAALAQERRPHGPPHRFEHDREHHRGEYREPSAEHQGVRHHHSSFDGRDFDRHGEYAHLGSAHQGPGRQPPGPPRGAMHQRHDLGSSRSEGHWTHGHLSAQCGHADRRPEKGPPRGQAHQGHHHKHHYASGSRGWEGRPSGPPPAAADRGPRAQARHGYQKREAGPDRQPQRPPRVQAARNWERGPRALDREMDWGRPPRNRMRADGERDDLDRPRAQQDFERRGPGPHGFQRRGEDGGETRSPRDRGPSDRGGPGFRTHREWDEPEI